MCGKIVLTCNLKPSGSIQKESFMKKKESVEGNQLNFVGKLHTKPFWNSNTEDIVEVKHWNLLTLWIN